MEESAETTSKTPPLSYEARKRFHARHGRRIVIAVIVVGAVLLGSRYGRPALTKAVFLWRQNRCMAYSDRTPDVPVFADGCWDNPALKDDFRLRSPEWEVLLHSHNEMKEFPFDLLYNGTHYCAGRIPHVWHDFFDRLPSPSASPFTAGGGSPRYTAYGTIFLGTLRSTNGTVRLVSVSLTRDTYWWGRDFRVEIVTPAGWRSPPSVFQDVLPKGDGSKGGHIGLFGPGQTHDGLTLGLKVYPGYRKIDDESSWEARLQIGHFEGKLIGQLQDDGTLQLMQEGIDIDAVREEEMAATAETYWPEWAGRITYPSNSDEALRYLVSSLSRLTQMSGGAEFAGTIRAILLKQGANLTANSGDVKSPNDDLAGDALYVATAIDCAHMPARTAYDLQIAIATRCPSAMARSIALGDLSYSLIHETPNDSPDMKAIGVASDAALQFILDDNNPASDAIAYSQASRALWGNRGVFAMQAILGETPGTAAIQARIDRLVAIADARRAQLPPGAAKRELDRLRGALANTRLNADRLVLLAKVRTEIEAQLYRWLDSINRGDHAAIAALMRFKLDDDVRKQLMGRADIARTDLVGLDYIDHDDEPASKVYIAPVCLSLQTTAGEQIRQLWKIRFIRGSEGWEIVGMSGPDGQALGDAKTEQRKTP